MNRQTNKNTDLFGSTFDRDIFIIYYKIIIKKEITIFIYQR